MIKFSSGFQKILIIASLSMLLAAIIIAAVSMDRIKNLEKEITRLKNPAQVELPTEEILKAGTVGEVKNSNSGENTELPQVIANVSGTIKEIKSDRLIIRGDGSTFSDNTVRDIVVIFTSDTITFITQENKYQGLEGLKYLQNGQEILISGGENIRGKTEFMAKTINIF